MYWLSVVLGLFIAWAILSFIGPRRTVSYYVQAPIRVDGLSPLEEIMEAVGLKPSSSTTMASVADEAMMAFSPASSPAPIVVEEPMMTSPAPAPTTVADAAAPPSVYFEREVMTMNAQYSTPDDQDTETTPQPVGPAPGPAPLIQ